MSGDAGMRCVAAAMLVMLLALQWRLWTGAGSLAEVHALEARVDAQRTENRVLSERNAMLAGEVRALKDGPESLEARARSELGMIRDGETFYIVLPAVERVSSGPQS